MPPAKSSASATRHGSATRRPARRSWGSPRRGPVTGTGCCRAMRPFSRRARRAPSRRWGQPDPGDEGRSGPRRLRRARATGSWRATPSAVAGGAVGSPVTLSSNNDSELSRLLGRADHWSVRCADHPGLVRVAEGGGDPAHRRVRRRVGARPRCERPAGRAFDRWLCNRDRQVRSAADASPEMATSSTFNTSTGTGISSASRGTRRSGDTRGNVLDLQPDQRPPDLRPRAALPPEVLRRRVCHPRLTEYPAVPGVAWLCARVQWRRRLLRNSGTLPHGHHRHGLFVGQ